MNKCCGLMGLIFGHKFEAREDMDETYSPEAAKLLDLSLSRITRHDKVLLPDDVEAIGVITDGYRNLSSQTSIYVKDVCVRCGEERVRSTDPKAPPTSFAEHFYKERREKWEKAKEYAQAAPERVACPHCFHVFGGNPKAVSLICPACAQPFNPPLQDDLLDGDNAPRCE